MENPSHRLKGIRRSPQIDTKWRRSNQLADFYD